MELILLHIVQKKKTETQLEKKFLIHSQSSNMYCHRVGQLLVLDGSIMGGGFENHLLLKSRQLRRCYLMTDKRGERARGEGPW